MGGAASYKLMESANGGGLVTVQNNGATSWSTGGRGNGTYVYQVQACNAGGCGPFSGQIAVTVSLIPAAPGMPNVVQKNPDYKPYFVVTWNAVAGATRYEVLESPDKGGATTVYNGAALTWTSGLKYYTGIIYYSVRACNNVGCSVCLRRRQSCKLRGSQRHVYNFAPSSRCSVQPLPDGWAICAPADRL